MAGHTHPEKASAMDRLHDGQHMTTADLRELKEQLPSMAPLQREKIDASLRVFEEKNRAFIDKDEHTKTALLDLRQSLDQKKEDAAGTAERMLREAGTVVGRETDTVTDNAKAIAYNQWTELHNPDRSTATKAAHVLGLFAVGYGVYRLAKWVMGKPRDSLLWKFLKFTGVVAVAGYAINRLGDDMKNKKAPKAEPAKKTATKAAKVEAPKKPAGKKFLDKKTGGKKHALEMFPQSRNLVGNGAHDIMVDGKAYKVQFTPDGIRINGKNYALTAKNVVPITGGDARLTIADASVEHGTLSFTAGAMGQSGTLEAQENDLADILRDLTAGKEVIKKTDDNITIQIARAS